jgi:hypothetical protein
VLNDPTFVEAARAFATRLLKEGSDDKRRLEVAAQLTWSRQPKPQELDSLSAFLASQREHYQANPADADKLTKIGLIPAPEVPAPELAAWTQVCRVILNAQETITRY